MSASPNPQAKPPISGIWSDIVAKCWEDETYRKKVLADPAAALREMGYPASSDVKYLVIEEKTSELKTYLSLPKKPDSKTLQDDALKKISAGQPCRASRG
jgi:hypothetical protein